MFYVHAVHCILQWAMCKEWCPQCKKPFDYLLCHRQLDGTLTDFLVEESVVLLKRARWFEDHMRVRVDTGACSKWEACAPGTCRKGDAHAASLKCT